MIKKAIVYLAGLLTVLRLICNLPEEIKNMPNLQDVKDAVEKAAQEVKDAVVAAVTKETADVVAQIQGIPVGEPVTQEFIDGLIASVKGIGTAAAASIDSISANDGGSQPTP